MKKIIGGVIIFLITACNCHHEGKGYIYDELRKQPMANVRIDVYSSKPWKDTIATPIYTDKNGYFEYSHDFCYDMIQAQYDGYYGFTFSDVSGDTLYLEKLPAN